MGSWHWRSGQSWHFEWKISGWWNNNFNWEASWWNSLRSFGWWILLSGRAFKYFLLYVQRYFGWQKNPPPSCSGVVNYVANSPYRATMLPPVEKGGGKTQEKPWRLNKPPIDGWRREIQSLGVWVAPPRIIGCWGVCFLRCVFGMLPLPLANQGL